MINFIDGIQNRARDLFYGLWIPDLFMRRVEEDGTWSLMCPDQCPGTPVGLSMPMRLHLPMYPLYLIFTPPMNRFRTRRLPRHGLRGALHALRAGGALPAAGAGPGPVVCHPRLADRDGHALHAGASRDKDGMVDSICFVRRFYPYGFVPRKQYKDACNAKSNQQNLGTIRSSNLCTEIIQYTSPEEVSCAFRCFGGLLRVVDQASDLRCTRPT